LAQATSVSRFHPRPAARAKASCAHEHEKKDAERGHAAARPRPPARPNRVPAVVHAGGQDPVLGTGKDPTMLSTGPRDGQGNGRHAGAGSGVNGGCMIHRRTPVLAGAVLLHGSRGIIAVLRRMEEALRHSALPRLTRLSEKQETDRGACADIHPPIRGLRGGNAGGQGPFSFATLHGRLLARVLTRQHRPARIGRGSARHTQRRQRGRPTLLKRFVLIARSTAPPAATCDPRTGRDADVRCRRWIIRSEHSRLRTLDPIVDIHHARGRMMAGFGLQSSKLERMRPINGRRLAYTEWFVILWPCADHAWLHAGTIFKSLRFARICR